MRRSEIKETYEDLCQEEAFEAFDCARVNPMEVYQALGHDVSQAYSDWIFRNVK